MSGSGRQEAMRTSIEEQRRKWRRKRKWKWKRKAGSDQLQSGEVEGKEEAGRNELQSTGREMEGKRKAEAGGRKQ